MAQAAAEFELAHILQGKTNISIDPNIPNPPITLKPTAKRDWLNVDISGQVSARFWATVGPSISVMVTPGLWASVYLALTGEVTMFGSLSIKGQAGNKGKASLMLEDPVVDCEDALGSRTIANDTRSNRTDLRSCGTMAVSARGAMEVTVMGPPRGYTAKKS